MLQQHEQVLRGWRWRGREVVVVVATGGRGGGGAVKLEVVVMAAAEQHACEIGSLFLARKPSTS